MMCKGQNGLEGTAPAPVALAPALCLPNAPGWLFSVHSSGHDGTCPEHSRGSRAEMRPKSGVSTPGATCFSALGTPISNRQIPRLETRLTSAKTTRAPLLIAKKVHFVDSPFFASARAIARPLASTAAPRLTSTRASCASRMPLRDADSLAQPRSARPKPAFLIDTACRLEIDLTPYRINTNIISNRRWIAGLHFADYVTKKIETQRWEQCCCCCGTLDDHRFLILAEGVPERIRDFSHGGVRLHGGKDRRHEIFFSTRAPFHFFKRRARLRRVAPRPQRV